MTTDPGYKINLHAHSVFSDGANSPYVMAQKAKEMGMCALVLTDHFYGPRHAHISVSSESYAAWVSSCKEASNLVLPVIRGLEVPYKGQEVLAFGESLIKAILKKRKMTEAMVRYYLENEECAFVLCHPGETYDEALEICVGYEHYHCGVSRFSQREPSALADTKIKWCNSDAHRAERLNLGYNIVDENITTASELITYLNSGKQPAMVAQDKLVN